MKPQLKKVLPVAIFGLGAVSGYVIGGMSAQPRPMIKSTPAQVKMGQQYTLYFVNFPPNTQLVSARNSTVVGGDLVNLGRTGPDGILTISNITAVGPVGAFYIYAFDAPTGQYCAVYTLIVS